MMSSSLPFLIRYRAGLRSPIYMKSVVHLRLAQSNSVYTRRMLEYLRTIGFGEFSESVGKIVDPNPRSEVRGDRIYFSSKGTCPVEPRTWVL